MAKSNKSENRIKTAAILVAAILILLSFVLIIVNCIGKASSTFTATYNGKVITSGRSFILPYSGEAQLEFSGYDGELIIEVLPNVDSKTDFEYTVDGKTYRFSETELTSVFITEKIADGKFKISCEPQKFALANVLLTAQSGVVLTSAIPRMDYPFKLVAATTAGERLEFSFAQFGIRFEPDGGHVF